MMHVNIAVRNEEQGPIKMLKYLQDRDILKGTLMLLKTRFNEVFDSKVHHSHMETRKGYSTQPLFILLSSVCALPILSQQHQMDICGALISADVNIFCFRDRKLWREVAGHCRAISVNDQR